jgi:phospholipid-binding lipoprotein MlaA
MGRISMRLAMVLRGLSIIGLALISLHSTAQSSLASAEGSSSDAEKSSVNVDPWEGFNRAMFSFNDSLDRYAMKPLAKGYRYVTPDFVETGFSNVFENLLELANVGNSVLQWKWKQAGNDGARFLINSTVGVLGLFDVAKPMGLERNEGEDFGQTLAVWGSGSGPYVVLPFFGPRTLRDAFALPVDMMTHPIGYVDHVPTRNTLTGMRFLTTRADLLDAEELIYGDKYLFIRDVYLQRRDFLIKDGAVEETVDTKSGEQEFGNDF